MSTTEIPHGPATAAPFMPEVKMVADRPDVAVPLRQILLRLARHEDDLAASEAAAVSYWAPSPASVSGHRAAAEALRSEADRFLQAS